MKTSLNESLQAIRLKTVHKTVLNNPYIPHKPTDKQFEFLFYSDILEGFYGGAAGGGKSDALLMAALQFMGVPGYSALILRRTYADLALPEALMDRAQEWLAGTDARWHADTKTWTFPSGATLTFGYLDYERSKYRYQGAAFQFCVAEGTAVLMADHSYKSIEDIEVGDMVQTLEGARTVTHAWGGRVSKCVKVTVHDGHGELIGTQIHPTDHEILTPIGWTSYDDVCTPCGILEPIQSDSDHISSLSPVHQFQSVSQKPLSQFDPTRRHYEPFGSYLDHSSREGCGVLKADHRSDSGESADGLREPLLLPSLTVPAMLHVPYPHLFLHGTSLYSLLGAERDVLNGTEAVTDSLWNCSLCSHRCDAQSHCQKDTVLRGLPLQYDAAGHIQSCCMLDALDNIPKHAHTATISYVHPYTKECRSSSEVVQYGSCVMTPAGKYCVYDISVDDVCHYITSSNIINKNCGFDEVTQFSEPMYQYLFSRLRRLGDSHIPIRMRAASNPGDIGHDWVKRRWILPTAAELRHDGRFFVPAFLEDNPHLDTASYEIVLDKLDPITREQLRRGNWDIGITGKIFKRQDFKIVESGAVGDQVRFWDLAATEEAPGKDPDWTVGCLMSEHGGRYWIKDIIRVREEAGEVERIIRQAAQIDGIETKVFMEQEGGASGKSLISHYVRNVLKGYAFEGVPSTGSKPVRAQPLAAAVSNGNVHLMFASWNSVFLDEAEQFPNGTHDDMVDAASQAFNLLYDPNAPIDSPLPTPAGGAGRFSPS